MMTLWKQLRATQPPAGPNPNPRIQVLGTLALIAMGIGATIGSGIFVTTGEVARAGGVQGDPETAFDTDYMLVRDADFGNAVVALQPDCHIVELTPPAAPVSGATP